MENKYDFEENKFVYWYVLFKRNNIDMPIQKALSKTKEEIFTEAEDEFCTYKWANEAWNYIFSKYRNIKLSEATLDEFWITHKIGDQYVMDNKPDKWKIAYYPIFEDGKTMESYEEPRALIEKPILGDKFGEIIGTDFREVPLRYLTRV